MADQIESILQMIDIQGDMWSLTEEFAPDAVCITTCQVLNHRGHLVMGAGIAKQAKAMHPSLPKLWGEAVREGRDIIITPGLASYALVAFHTKTHWKDPSTTSLIKESAKGLLQAADLNEWQCIFLPRPGCSNGGLRWEKVKPVLEEENQVGGREGLMALTTRQLKASSTISKVKSKTG
jgi:hypothetical protein